MKNCTKIKYNNFFLAGSSATMSQPRTDRRRNGVRSGREPSAVQRHRQAPSSAGYSV